MDKEIKSCKFKDGFAFGFEIKSISDFYDANKAILTVPHRAEFYQIIWIQKGGCTHHVDFRPVEVAAGSILFVPQSCVSHFDSSATFDGKILFFTDEFFCKEQADASYLNTTFLFNNLYDITQISLDENSCQLGSLFRSMEQEALAPNDAAQADILKNYLHNFLLLAEREKRKQGYKDAVACQNLEYFLSFKKLLEGNYKSEKQVSRYASDLNITEKRLSKATSSILGRTPKVMIAERVLLEAKRLLVYSNLTVKEVAFDLGFDEATNFIKYFKKQTDKTPSEFREGFRQYA